MTVGQKFLVTIKLTVNETIISAGSTTSSHSNLKIGG